MADGGSARQRRALAETTSPCPMFFEKGTHPTPQPKTAWTLSSWGLLKTASAGSGDSSRDVPHALKERFPQKAFPKILLKWTSGMLGSGARHSFHRAFGTPVLASHYAEVGWTQRTHWTMFCGLCTGRRIAAPYARGKHEPVFERAQQPSQDSVLCVHTVQLPRPSQPPDMLPPLASVRVPTTCLNRGWTTKPLRRKELAGCCSGNPSGKAASRGSRRVEVGLCLARAVCGRVGLCGDGCE
ncbi:MAG: hypothetical protein JWN34_4923, partial [Bryobacterales bacterium]|nr:hypothetical protein [Bryobacterales bacterium]